MKRLFLAAVLLASPARAQFATTTTTAPPGDSTTRIASTAFVQAAVPLAAITALSGDVVAVGPGAVVATIQAGVVTAAKMAAGAAATNVGALGGQLTGTLPNPNIATGTVTNANLANMAAGTVKCNPTGGSTGAPRDCSQPVINVLDYNASGSTQTTTGTISATSNSLSLASAVDFVNGQGIRINHAGAAFAVNQVTGASATPQGTPGATTYTYTISTVDLAGGVGAAITNFTTATGNATLSGTNFNKLSWTAPGSGPAPAGYAIYGRIGGSLTLLALVPSFVTTFNDYGLAGITPDWIPNTPPGASVADWLVTTISAGAGTTTLTLANTAATTASGQFVGHDDAAAINNAIGASPATGATILFPCLSYPIATQIVVGNGSSSAVSTVNGITLQGICNPVSSIFPQPERPRLLWTGGPSAMVQISGPLEGWGVQNIFFNCNFLANNGLIVTSARFGESKNLSFSYCLSAALNSGAVSALPPGTTNVDSLKNHYYNMTFALPVVDTALAIFFGQSTVGDTDANEVFGTYIVTSAVAQNAGIVLGSADIHYFYGTLIAGGAAGTKIQFQYPGSNQHSAGTVFFGVDVGCVGVTPCNEWGNNGTPSAAATPNYIYGLNQGNGGHIPNLANLAVFNGSNIILAPGGTALAAANTQIPYPARSTFSPSPSCGTATFTVNSARFNTQGKETLIEADISITAIGTCTNTVSITLPNTAASPAILSGRNISGTANSQNATACQLATGSTTGSCINSLAANFVVNDRFVVSGSYENQ